MTGHRAHKLSLVASVLLAGLLAAVSVPADGPVYVLDDSWPDPLPATWGAIGEVAGQAVDADGHIWIIHRGYQITGVVPPVLEFDRNGTLLQAWGGPGAGYTWPTTEHGLYVDADGNVWTAGNTHQVLKFTHDGRFLMAIGVANSTGGSDDTSRLGSAADIVVDPIAGEVYVADGYANHRVIVFDATTGEYRRHWGAYGEPPNDLDATPRAFGLPVVGPVHCVEMSADRLIYVCDRDHYRIQVFRPDGTFVREHFIREDGGEDPAALLGVCTPQCGPAFDVAFSPDPEQRLMLVAVSYDIAPANAWQTRVFGPNEHVLMLERATGALLGRIGTAGTEAGAFTGLHGVVTDADGAVYTGEITGARAQRFVPT